MIGIVHGVDLIEIKRFDQLNPAIRGRFLHRVFTLSELEECGESAPSLAGKFAAKEAAAKALGCGIGRVSWQELEIHSNEQGKPSLLLHGNARTVAEKEGWISWSLSITHTSGLALASVTALIELT